MPGTMNYDKVTYNSFSCDLKIKPILFSLEMDRFAVGPPLTIRKLTRCISAINR